MSSPNIYVRRTLFNYSSFLFPGRDQGSAVHASVSVPEHPGPPPQVHVQEEEGARQLHGFAAAGDGQGGDVQGLGVQQRAARWVNRLRN